MKQFSLSVSGKSQFLLRLCFIFIVSSSCFSEALSQVVINELLASNQNTDTDDFFEYEDWIEFYNPGGIVNLAGYYLTDDPAVPTLWQFPSTNPGITTILPGGFLRIWCDRDLVQGEDHADFKLSSDGETLQLVAPDGTTVIDEVTFGPQQADISFGRSCDACPDWMFFESPTPLSTNQASEQSTEQLYFNEFQSLNLQTLPNAMGQFLPWVELFNPNPYQVWLANYTFEVEGIGSYTFPPNLPASTTVPAGGFLLVYLDGTGSGNHTSFEWPTLSPPSQPVFRLSGPSGGLVHEWTMLDVPADHSFGALVDGSPTWVDFSSPTPGVTNQLILIPGGPLKINEVLTSNLSGISDEMGQREDWLEVHNAGNQAIDLAGYYFTDAFDQPMKWRVPVGIPEFTVIPAGGFKLFWADDDASQGWNHMTFRFNATGEHLALRSPDGFTVVDSLFFPALPSDISWGRLTDGGLPWVQFLQTTPEASNSEGVVGLHDSEASPGWFLPNPILVGNSVAFHAPARIFDSSGRWIRDLKVGESWTASAPGIYLVRWLEHEKIPGASIQRIVVQG